MGTLNRDYTFLDAQGADPESVINAVQLPEIDSDVQAAYDAIEAMKPGTAFTQTYSTASVTVDPLSTSAFTGQDNAQVGSVYAKAADIEQLRQDVINLHKVANALIDLLQEAEIAT